MRAAVSPTSCLSMPAILTSTGLGTAKAMPAGGAIADTHQFEGLLVAGGDADHHVVHQGARKPPHGAGAGGIVTRREGERPVFVRHHDLVADGPRKLALGALYRDALAVETDGHAGWNGNRLLADPGHLNTPGRGLRRRRWRRARRCRT